MAARAAATLLAAALSSGCPSAEPVPPNLLLITTGPMGPSALGCFAGPPEAGTEICALQAAVRIAWSAEPTSGIASTLTSILTSRPASEHPVDETASTFLPSAFTTLAEVLRQSGYATAGVVGSPALNQSRNLQQGFEVFVDRPHDPATRSRAGLSPRQTTEAALDWARRTPPPWLLWVHFDAEPSALDREFSQLVRELDGLGVDPGVLFTGLGPAAHAEGSPGSLSVPLLWRSPDKRPIPPERIRPVARNIDVAPTLVQAANLAPVAEFRGHALFAPPPAEAAVEASATTRPHRP